MMMKAVNFIPKTTKTEVIQIEKPSAPSDLEMVVKVKYAAMDTALDAVINKTMVGGFVHANTDPLVLGWHYSGTVESIGNQVEDFQLGDEVFGFIQYAPETAQGSIAEYITVKADACAIKPKSVKWDVATASSTEVLTALQSLRDEGGIASGKKQSVLINGGGGQVGRAAIQIAKRMGCHTTAICSTKDVASVSKLGADVVIDRKTTTDVYSVLKKGQFDLIFDTPPAMSVATALKYLKSEGSIVVTLPTLSMIWGMICAMFTKKSVKMVSVKSTKSDLEQLGKWLEDGFEVQVDSVFAAKDTEKAAARNRDGNKCGRVVVQIENGW